MWNQMISSVTESWIDYLAFLRGKGLYREEILADRVVLLGARRLIGSRPAGALIASARLATWSWRVERAQRTSQTREKIQSPLLQRTIIST